MSKVCLAAVAPMLLVAGCASGSQRPAPVPVRQPSGVQAIPAVVALSPAAYVAAAASADLFVVRASELALQRLGSERDRALAETLIRGHEGMSAQLSLSGRRLNLLPSASLLPQHQARLSELMASPDFAGTYRREMLTVQQELLGLHDGFATKGSSPTLRPVASAAAATVRRHLSQMR